MQLDTPGTGDLGVHAVVAADAVVNVHTTDEGVFLEYAGVKIPLANIDPGARREILAAAKSGLMHTRDDGSHVPEAVWLATEARKNKELVGEQQKVERRMARHLSVGETVQGEPLPSQAAGKAEPVGKSETGKVGMGAVIDQIAREIGFDREQTLSLRDFVIGANKDIPEYRVVTELVRILDKREKFRDAVLKRGREIKWSDQRIERVLELYDRVAKGETGGFVELELAVAIIDLENRRPEWAIDNRGWIRGGAAALFLLFCLVMRAITRRNH